MDPFGRMKNTLERIVALFKRRKDEVEVVSVLAEDDARREAHMMEAEDQWGYRGFHNYYFMPTLEEVIAFEALFMEAKYLYATFSVRINVRDTPDSVAMRCLAVLSAACFEVCHMFSLQFRFNGIAKAEAMNRQEEIKMRKWKMDKEKEKRESTLLHQLGFTKKKPLPKPKMKKYVSKEEFTASEDYTIKSKVFDTLYNHEAYVPNGIRSILRVDFLAMSAVHDPRQNPDDIPKQLMSLQKLFRCLGMKCAHEANSFYRDSAVFSVRGLPVDYDDRTFDEDDYNVPDDRRVINLMLGPEYSNNYLPHNRMRQLFTYLHKAIEVIWVNPSFMNRNLANFNKNDIKSSRFQQRSNVLRAVEFAAQIDVGNDFQPDFIYEGATFIDFHDKSLLKLQNDQLHPFDIDRTKFIERFKQEATYLRSIKTYYIGMKPLLLIELSILM